uniref:Uncharacterized protein n=1 Tax=viral metagenome TaxID=1070528 RepID=A0A6C0CB36_9ZZZZ
MQRCFAPKKRVFSISRKKLITRIPKFDLEILLFVAQLVTPGAPKKIRPTSCKRKDIKTVPRFNLDEFENTLITIHKKYSGKAAASGKAYERDTLDVCHKIKFKGSSSPLTTKKNTAGSSAGVDVIIKHGVNEIGIECKKKFVEGMQMTLQFDRTSGSWKSGGKNKIPEDAKILFEKNIGDMKIFNGKIPKFMNEKITHDEWLRIKKSSPDFSDVRFPCSNNLISKMYHAKGCQYIQVGSHGLYHTYQDVCGFGVPYFECESFIRIRTKIHARNKQGYMAASVTSSVMPCMLKIQKSPFSLDSFDQLPKNVQLL